MDPGNSKTAGRLVLTVHLISLFTIADFRGVMSAFLTHIGVTGMSISKCRSPWPRQLRRGSVGARLLALGGFESCRGHGCLPLVGVVCCQVQVSATGWSLVQRIRTESDLETSTRRRPRSSSVVEQREKILQDNPGGITWCTGTTVGGKPKFSNWQPA